MQANETEVVQSGRAIYYDPHLQIIFGVALMAALRTDSISPAFPEIRQTFQLSSESVGLLVTAFALPSVFLTPILGILADRWGRKQILVPSLLLFALAGGASSLARDFDLLLTLRLIQGIGVASLSMLNITLIADFYSGQKIIAAMGYNAAVRSLGSTMFPLVGGGLAILGWYYPFAMALLGIPVALLIAFGLRNPKPEERPNFKEYVQGAWQSLKHRQVVGLFLAGCVVFIIIFGAYLTYFPLLLSDQFGALPVVIGLLVSGRSVVNMLIASQMGRLVKIQPEKVFLSAAFVLYGLVFLVIPFVTALWGMAGVTLLLGMAEGFYWPSNHALLGKLAPMRHRAGFMALNDMILKVGQTSGPLLMGAVFSGWGMSGVFGAAAILSFATWVLVTVLMRP